MYDDKWHLRCSWIFDICNCTFKQACWINSCLERVEDMNYWCFLDTVFPVQREEAHLWFLLLWRVNKLAFSASSPDSRKLCKERGIPHIQQHLIMFFMPCELSRCCVLFSDKGVKELQSLFILSVSHIGFCMHAILTALWHTFKN